MNKIENTKTGKILEKLESISDLSGWLRLTLGPRNDDKIQEYVKDIRELLEAPQELNIKDLISFVGTSRKVEVLVNDEWLEALVVGIDLESDSVKLNIIDGTTYNPFWKQLYYRLNENHPKHFKVKLA